MSYRIYIHDGRHCATMMSDGSITIEDPNSAEVLLSTTATELLYIVQEYQERFGGVPVKIDWDSFRGLSST